MPDLVIFDCDGTLSRSDEAYYHGFCDALAKHGFPVPGTHEYQEKYSGRLIGDIIRAYGEQMGRPLPPEIEKYYWLLEQPYLEKYTMAVEGARPAVETLQRSYKTCVASNASLAGISFLLDRAGLADLFPAAAIFSYEQVARPKPAADVFLYAADRMGAAPHTSVVIEDSVGGVRAGVAAAMRVIGFTGTAPHPDAKADMLLQEGAIACFRDWQDIVTCVQGLS